MKKLITILSFVPVERLLIVLIVWALIYAVVGVNSQQAAPAQASGQDMILTCVSECTEGN